MITCELKWLKKSTTFQIFGIEMRKRVFLCVSGPFRNAERCHNANCIEYTVSMTWSFNLLKRFTLWKFNSQCGNRPFLSFDKKNRLVKFYLNANWMLHCWLCEFSDWTIDASIAEISLKKARWEIWHAARFRY